MIVEQTVEPKPWKRFCVQGHDTWVVGRNQASRGCAECNRRQVKKSYDKNRLDHRYEYASGLKDLRVSWGISLNALAEEAGMWPQSISRIELCQRRAPEKTRLKLLHALWFIRRRSLEPERETKLSRARALGVEVRELRKDS